MTDDAERALRAFEQLPSLQPVAARESGRRFERSPRTSGALALDERPDYTSPPPAARPRAAAERAYGTHRRGDRAIAGYQPGRRTVEITGQVQPRRRSQTGAAFAARPDRAALWAFLLALFLVVMAIATAHP